MTNTQTKVARLTRRVERLERALGEIVTLAHPTTPADAPICYDAWRRLGEIVTEIRRSVNPVDMDTRGAFNVTAG